MITTPSNPISNPAKRRRLKRSNPSDSAMGKANIGTMLSSSDSTPEGRCTAAM